MTTAFASIPKKSPRQPSKLVLAALGVCLMSGCSTMGKHKTDPNDVCYTQREELAGSENYYAKSVAEGVAVGALGGAALGAATAWATGQNVGTGAAVGAGTGAVVGGVGAYYLAKQKVAADAAALASSIQDDILRENGEIEKASIAFAHLRDCRLAAAESVRADYRAQRITREQAESKLNDLKSKFLEDIDIAEDLGSKMGENMKEFQSASDQLLAQNSEAKTLFTDYQTRSAERSRRKAWADSHPPKKPPKKGHKPVVEDLPGTDFVAQAPCGKKKSKKACHPGGAGAKPSSPLVASSFEVAKATESGQLKQKAFKDQRDSARAEAGKAFTLEGNVQLIAPENWYCGI